MRGLAVFLALGLGFLVLSPALRCAFLTDDYYLGATIAEVKATDPAPLAQLRAAFVHQWTPAFEVFRPFTIATVQVDYALHGIDGGRHHLTNVLLWLLLALVFQDLVARLGGRGDALSRSLSTLAFAVYPGAVEAIGWLVAREDLLMTFFGTLAVWLLVVHPARTWPATLALVPAFLAKETAVTLPPLLLIVDLLLVKGRGQGSNDRPLLTRTLRRHAAPFGLILLYLLTRFALFGSIGTNYNNRSFGSYLTEDGVLDRTLAHLGDSVARLAAPISESALHAFHPGLPWIVASLALAAPAALFVHFGHVRSLGGSLSLIVTCLAWIVGPILLLAPIHGVGPDLQVSRMLALPAVGFLIAVITGWHSWRSRWPRSAMSLGILWILIAAGAMVLDLGSYRRASERARTLRNDLQAPFASRRVIALRLEVPQRPGQLHPALMTREGVHVLSAGLFSAARPPFRHPPLSLESLRRDQELTLATSASDPPPAIVALTFEGEEPRLIRVAPGGGRSIEAALLPDHGAQLPATGPAVFSIASTALDGISSVRFVWTDPLGGRIEHTIGPQELESLRRAGRATIDATLPVPLSFLRSRDCEFLFWWVELEGADGRRHHLRYRVAVIPRG